MTIFCTIGLLSACQPNEQKQQSNAKIYSDDTHVYLHKSHILAIKPTLYQPSFELSGTMQPAIESTLIAPTSGTLIWLFVEPNQQVKKNDKLAVLLPTWDKNKHIQKPKPITIKAKFDGIITALFVQENAYVSAGQAIAVLTDNHHFEFVSTLPSKYASKLRIGQSVNFTTARQTDNANNIQTFSGQIAHIHADTNDAMPDSLAITVHILPDKNNQLNKGMHVSGRVSNDDLNVGALIPQHSLIDAQSFDILKKAPYEPPLPLPAQVWVIRQDETLDLTDVLVVGYQPDTNKFLVTGISQDSLIATAPLPTHADGKKVNIY